MSDGSQPTALLPHRRTKLAAAGVLLEACSRLERARAEWAFANISDLTAVYDLVRRVEDDLRTFSDLANEYEQQLDTAAIHSSIVINSELS